MKNSLFVYFLHSFKIMGKKTFWWNWFTIDTVIDCSIYTIYIIIITSHLLLIEINYLINFNVVLYLNCTINEHLTAVIVLYHWNNSLRIMLHSVLVWFGSMMLNATFNNISVISWWSVLLVEETGVSGENHWSVACHWQISPLGHITLIPSQPFFALTTRSLAIQFNKI